MAAISFKQQNGLKAYMGKLINSAKRGFGRALKALGVKNMQVRFVFTEVKVILQKI